MQRLEKKDVTGSISLLTLVVVIVLASLIGYFVYTKFKDQTTQKVSNLTNVEKNSIVAGAVVDLDKLPLGDNKYSITEASKGYIYSCIKIGGGGGAFKEGEWIDATNGTWSKKNKKVIVDGSVDWPLAKFQVSDTFDARELIGNGLPINHSTGLFPVSRKDDAYNYDRNPNAIQAQKILESVPLNPRVSQTPRCLNMGPVGYSLNGVAIFNALDGEGRDAAAHEILDKCGGHPERTGEYHYHDYSECMTEKSSEPKLIGYMLDGFGLYKYPINPTNKDLDECHGVVGEVNWNGKNQSIYHYVITDEYPYTIGCFRGD